MSELKYYKGRIPACGVYCGGCPNFQRERRPCPGAEINFSRCDKCKTFHLCCKERGITHCYECGEFPCKKFKSFAKNWQKYGQNFIDNQKTLKEKGAEEFFKSFHDKGS